MAIVQAGKMGRLNDAIAIYNLMLQARGPLCCLAVLCIPSSARIEGLYCNPGLHPLRWAPA